MTSQSWKLGNPGSLTYRLYDQQRNWLNGQLASYLHSFIKDTQEARIIEAGSGPAMCASLLKNYNNVKETHALDFDPEVIELIQKRDSKIIAHLGDLRKMTFDSNTFDLVYNSSTIEHLDDTKTAFGEMIRICKAGGIVFTGIPYKYGPLFPSLIFSESGGVRQWVGKFIPRQEVLDWAKEFGADLIAERTYYFGMFKGFVFRKKSN